MHEATAEVQIPENGTHVDEAAPWKASKPVSLFVPMLSPFNATSLVLKLEKHLQSALLGSIALLANATGDAISIRKR